MEAFARLLIFDLENPRLITSCVITVMTAAIIYFFDFRWQYFWISLCLVVGWMVLGNVKDRQLEIISLLKSIQKESSEKSEALAWETRKDIADLREEIKEIFQELIP